MDVNLSSILSSTSAFLDQSDENSQKISDLVTQGNQVTESRIRADNEAANAAQVKAQAELGEVARQEAARKAIAARIGADPSQTGWVIGKAADQIAIAQKGLADANDQIQQKESINFLTNPLGWIAAKSTVNQDYANYNYYARMNNNAEDAAAAAATLSTEAYKQSNALSSTTTEAYVGAMKILAAHQYIAQSGEAAMQGVRWNMEGIVASTNISREKLQSMYSANSAVMQDKQYQAELSRLNLAKQEFDLHKQAFQDKKDEDTLTLKYIQDGYFSLSGKMMDPMSAKNALILFRAKDPKTVAMFNAGLDSSMVTNGTGSKPVLSLSPAKATEIYGKGWVSNMSPAMDKVGEQLMTWRTQFQNPATQQQYGVDPKDKNSLEVGFNEFVKKQQQQTLSSVAPDSVFAPYPIDKVAALNRNIASLPVWKNVLEPASKTGVDINDPNTAFGVVTSAMREGKVSYVDALDLSLMYAAGLDLNNQTRNFLAFGLSKAGTYNAPISIPGSIGKTTVNLVDRKFLSTALNRAEASHALEDSIRSQQEGYTPRMR